MNRILFAFLFSFLCFNGYASIDTTSGFSAPNSVSGNVIDLTTYLCEGLFSDTAKANMIFNWITHNIEYDIKAAKDPDRDSPNIQEILKGKKTISEGYSMLFVEMCKSVGLDAGRVGGYVKGWTVDNGDQNYMPRHEWCAVKIDRRWELVDPTFGSGGVSLEPDWLRSKLNIFSKDDLKYAKREVFEFKYEPYYFLVDPIQFRRTHLPEDPLWQLAQVQMPLDVFEQGDSAIVKFNIENPNRINRAQELEHIATLNDLQRLVESSDRVYKFNDSFDMAMARKEYLNGLMVLERYLSHRNMPQRAVVEDAYRGTVLADRYLDNQKSYISPHYNNLKKKNIDKNRLAKEHFRDVTVLNKQLSAQCKRRVSTSERKLNTLSNRQDKTTDIQESISEDKIDSVETVTVQKDKDNPIMRTLSDSISAKRERLKRSSFSQIDKIQSITLLQEKSRVIMDTFLYKHTVADTVLQVETQARVRFRDSYDDDIRAYVQLLNQFRQVDCDRLLNNYLLNFDTLIIYYEELQKLYDEQIRLYKSTFRDMEQYRKWNNTEDIITSIYRAECKKYAECLSQYQQTMVVYQKYLDKNTTLLNKLITDFTEELEFVAQMDTAETARKEAEEKEMNEGQIFDERIIENYQQSVKKLQQQLTDILSK